MRVKAQRNCDAPESGWVRGELYKVRNWSPDVRMSSETDYSQNRFYNYNAYPTGCSDGGGTARYYKGTYNTHLGQSGEGDRSGLIPCWY